MDKKYQVLINQLIQWHHLEPKEFDDLRLYLESHIRTIDIRKKNELWIEPELNPFSKIEQKIQSQIEDVNQMDEDEPWEYLYSQYIDELCIQDQEEWMSPLEAIDRFDSNEIDFNIWFEKWYIQWMREMLKLFNK